MDEIIKRVRRGIGYRMGNREIQILCYEDDAVIMAESEDDLQRLLHVFNTTAKKIMLISVEITKCMSREPLRGKLEVDGKVIKHESSFGYLSQVARANKVAGCLNNTIWKNRNLRMETKTPIYKTTIRPIMIYTAETRPDTFKTRRLLETTEMRVLRRITGKTMRDRERSENIRRECKTKNINESVKGRKMEWNRHIGRMTEDRLVRIARDMSPSGRRSVGRPRKRWSDDIDLR
ncbi:uncharacterized protein LOC123310328 [Coccinella septempunctata]|uniref:uncharacterized protein LOC123310328 n=1 Tax=Coccinella septempunctata TaxID=41139 RepID=UPI001D078386|nr:uncharacterized protein LOC123310328 [Coccinella septempunctata]